MPPHKKKVLIISYYFPPSGGAGVQRTLKFVKYLRHFGWEPVVLTAKNADYPAIDESLQSQIPEDIKIYKSRIFEPYRFYRKFTGRREKEATDIATLSLDKIGKQKLSERISEWIRSVFFVPDARIFWWFFAVPLGKKIIKQEKIDVIFSSAPPYTTHLIGLKLKKVSQLPWVADFRDSWIGWLSTPQWRPAISRELENKMELSVLKNADKILTVSFGVKEDLLSRQPKLADNKWQFFPNGYDAEDFHDIIPTTKTHKITITYTGSMYGLRNPEFLLRALELLKQEQHPKLNNFDFKIVGRIGESVLQRIHSSSVKDLFEIIPYVTHRECLSYLLSTDVSLLIIDDSPLNSGILTGKLFEYIGAGKLILALAPEGEATDLIRNNNLGLVASPNNVDQIKKCLLKLISKKEAGSLPHSISENIKIKFERKEQTRNLSAILDSMITKI